MNLPINTNKSSKVLIVEGGGMRGAFAGGVDDVVPDEVLSDAHSGVVGVFSGRESADAGLVGVGSVVLAQ